ncbi:hypothetical protein FGO68_gene7089 [Halteria grandinella]|uniref:Uncharacterized protein n=1 Tax=Halteria grandinella TaxID=5974 RepID=A0A8J8SUR1_HALGN|nr:hypothetical protein FGO68_gene7089 [Halteria grandinella]
MQQSKEESKQQTPLQEQVQQGFSFLQVFVNNQSGCQEYQMHIKVKATLRDYQRQGITWLASLGKYNLNCALCDDMGLGKTLQALCVILNESHIKREVQQSLKKGQPKGGAGSMGNVPVVNLIVCPTTITYNWKMEIGRYFEGVRVAVYEGSTGERKDIIEQAKQGKVDVIIASYDKVRNDIELFLQLRFFYVALDEGHIIKNPKAKTTKAVKQLLCDKKLVLTGTPLQNKVAELWSIFDFLMPGFLEEEGLFNKKYNQYLTSNIKKLSEKLEETQNFITALKSLKKRIQPFILRRTKDEVLKELPPKIIQDVPCKMTSFQQHVHTLLEKAHPIIASLQQAKSATKQDSHLKNVLRHRKVCNHPMYIARDFIEDKSVANYIGKKSEKELNSYEQSGKLLGLIDKLTECEIIKEESSEGVDNGLSMMVAGDGAVQGHRALIFCQMKSFLQMIIDQVLIPFKVPYMELDSSLSSQQRMEIVERFNHDSSIKVLILTTKVGGLGLTLTGADTVIFAEHDWNPMSDLQAIDRAHRIGQTRQVCVYRLITQDTLEEKIMNLQRFKENLAKSLVQSRESSAVEGMEITDLLNSFQEHSAFTAAESGQKKGAVYEDKLISGIDAIWQGAAFSVEDL